MPSDFISREAALKTLYDEIGEENEEVSMATAYEILLYHFQRIPAADVVPVVRCKDCKHYSPHPTDAEYGGKGWCRKLQGQAKQDFFCAAGAHEDGGEHYAD